MNNDKLIKKFLLNSIKSIGIVPCILSNQDNVIAFYQYLVEITVIYSSESCQHNF
jgi:hypothetical protein